MRKGAGEFDVAWAFEYRSRVDARGSELARIAGSVRRRHHRDARPSQAREAAREGLNHRDRQSIDRRRHGAGRRHDGGDRQGLRADQPHRARPRRLRADGEAGGRWRGRAATWWSSIAAWIGRPTAALRLASAGSRWATIRPISTWRSARPGHAMQGPREPCSRRSDRDGLAATQAAKVRILSAFAWLKAAPPLSAITATIRQHVFANTQLSKV